MHDIRWIRDAPLEFDAAMARRGLAGSSEEVLAIDAQRRTAQTRLQELQQRRNDASKQIGQVKRQGGDAQPLMDEVAQIKDEMAALEEQERQLADRLNDHLSALPNALDPDVPDGSDDDDNIEVRRWGDPAESTGRKEHFDVGEQLRLMDFEAAARMSGSRFVVLRGHLARLERAIGQYMIDLQTREHGYTEMAVPLLVRDEAVFGTGQLPKFSEDLFKTTTGHWLIPTSEVALTNLVMTEILAEETLPLRVTALTPCFRSEAGAAGKDTRGMIRQHQFHKVELVSITTPDQSTDELHRMVDCAETVLKTLNLPFRTVLKCVGDTGFSARRSYDIEVWLPGQGRYREISSCSNCGDFQARRMNARCRAKGEKQTRFVHTLNGSGLAVGRTLIAVMETYQQADGTISVPEPLLPYMGGVTRIGG